MNAIAATPTLSTDPLWTRAGAMYARAVAAIGNAASIALLDALPRPLRRQIIGWLYPLECIVRRLLIAEAAVLHRAEQARAARRVRIEYVPLRGMAQHYCAPKRSARPAASSKAAKAAAAGAARSGPDLSQPDTWPARFRFSLPRDPRVAPNSRAPRIIDLWGPYVPPPAPPSRTRRIVKLADARFRLACRFEALRRVIENPLPHAERLARMLAHAARRVPKLVQRYVLAGARTDGYDPEDARLSLDALGAAIDAPDAFKDTS